MGRPAPAWLLTWIWILEGEELGSPRSSRQHQHAVSFSQADHLIPAPVIAGKRPAQHSDAAWIGAEDGQETMCGPGAGDQRPCRDGRHGTSLRRSQVVTSSSRTGCVMYEPVADIDRLVAAAKVAPSVLNTQPWLFEIVARDRINLRAQRDRWLRNIDPDGRELAISCGAALFNFRLALSDAGHDQVVWLMPDEKNDPDLLASVEIVTARVHPPTVNTQRLYEAIPWRHTNRQPFEKKVVGVNIVAELEHAAWQERAHLWLLHQRMTRTLLAEIERANGEEKNDKTYWGYEFQQELEEYTNESKLREGLGIPPGAFGPLPANAPTFVFTVTINRRAAGSWRSLP